MIQKFFQNHDVTSVNCFTTIQVEYKHRLWFNDWCMKGSNYSSSDRTVLVLLWFWFCWRGWGGEGREGRGGLYSHILFELIISPPCLSLTCSSHLQWYLLTVNVTLLSSFSTQSRLRFCSQTGSHFLSHDLRAQLSADHPLTSHFIFLTLKVVEATRGWAELVLTSPFSSDSTSVQSEMNGSQHWCCVERTTTVNCRRNFLNWCIIRNINVNIKSLIKWFQRFVVKICLWNKSEIVLTHRIITDAAIEEADSTDRCRPACSTTFLAF